MSEAMSRAAAFILDFLLVIFLIQLINAIFQNSSIGVLFIIPLIFFYHLTFEIFMMGQSPGKKLLKLRVVTTSGGNPTLKALIIRWAFRFVDIALTMGTIAFVSIYASGKSQRIGDILAGTTVIKTKLGIEGSLDHITKLDNIKKELKYDGQLSKYTDDEMLLVKSVIQRYVENQTPANELLVTKTAEKFIAELGLNIKNYKGYTALLKDVLEEYIIVTR